MLSHTVKTINACDSVFVTGPARSGTELVRGMLNRHHAVHLAAETHYFDDLRPRLGTRAVAGLEGKDRIHAVAYFRALRHRAYGLAGDPEAADWPHALLDEEARALGGGADAIFEAYCRLCASDVGKKIWGEKTPRHVYRIDEIFSAFPNAHVVVVLRDVRGVIASYRDWRNRWFEGQVLSDELAAAVAAEEGRAAASYSLTLNTLLWCSAVRTALRMARCHGPDRVSILRFEDVLLNPTATAKALCDRIGVPFDPAMLEAGVVNSSYTGNRANQGFDITVSERWRERLSIAERRHVDLVAGRIMAELGYDRDRLGVAIRASSWEFTKTAIALFRALAHNRERIANPLEYIRTRAAALFK